MTIVLDSTAVGTGVSLKTYRQKLAQDIGFYVLSTTTAANSTTTNITLGDLADSALTTDYYNNVWVIVTSTTSGLIGQTRRIKTDGYAPATGIMTLTRGFSSASTNGTEVELHGVLPPVAMGGMKGWREIINDALRECWAIDKLSIAPANSTTYTHTLSDLPWIPDEDDFIEVWQRSTGAETDSIVPEWRFEYNADAPVIELRKTLSTADRLKPMVYRPMDTWIKVGNSWGNSTSGLVNDSDQALLPLEGMERIGKAIAYEYLATRGDHTNQEYYEKLAQRWRTRADAWKQRLPKLPRRDSHWVTARTSYHGVMHFTGAVG